MIFFTHNRNLHGYVIWWVEYAVTADSRWLRCAVIEARVMTRIFFNLSQPCWLQQQEKMEMKLEGKTAVITGGNRGIGLATAKLLGG